MSSNNLYPKTGLLSRLFSFLQRLLRRDTSESQSTTSERKEIESRLIQMLRSEEGVIPTLYKDHLGYDTIGVGHLVDARRGGGLPDWAQEELNQSGRLTDESINSLLLSDIKEKETQLNHALPWAKDLDCVRYCVLVDMCFQMGIGGLLGFNNTLRYIKEGNYDQAAKNMLVSKWAKQTPNRAKRRADEMRTGVAYNYN